MGAAGKAINLYNIDRDLFVGNAPVKNQCSGDYFYGTDTLLEDAIQAVEQAYGRLVREIHEPGYQLTEEDRSTLKLFWLMQHLRTEAASRRAAEMTNAMGAVADPDAQSFRIEIKDAVQVAMRIFAESMDVVSDLKVCLVRNRSNVPFVSSDDPAVLSNRWHLQNAKRMALSFGLGNSGTLLILPLSPEVLFLGYDGDMHSCAHRDGWVEFRKDSDADAFNQHQFLNSRANLFVRNPEHFEAIRTAFLRVSGNRPKQRHRIYYAVLDKTEGEYSRYTVVDRKNAAPGERGLIHSQAIHAVPTGWPSLLRWRTGAFYYSNGTGVGCVRRAYIREDGGRPFQKLKAFTS